MEKPWNDTILQHKDRDYKSRGNYNIDDPKLIFWKNLYHYKVQSNNKKGVSNGSYILQLRLKVKQKNLQKLSVLCSIALTKLAKTFTM